MSRGPGSLQRRICVVLCDSAEGELPLRELRRRLGEPDRSNLRRAIRGLLEREIVEESRPGGEPRVGLTVWSYIGMSSRLSSPGSRQAFITGSRQAGRRGPQAGRGEGSGRSRQGRHPVRDSPLGETQQQILGALHTHGDVLPGGLPVTLVKSLVGADRSNLRRAVRTLLRRGLLEESEDGGRIRLSPSGAVTAYELS